MADATPLTSVITAIATAVTAGVLVYNAWRKYYNERPNVQIKLSVETVNDDEDSHRVCVRIANGGKNGVFVDGYKVIANRKRELYSSDDGDVTGMLAPGSIVKHRVDYDWLASELGEQGYTDSTDLVAVATLLTKERFRSHSIRIRPLH